MPLPIQRYISNELTHFVGRSLDTKDQYSVLQDIISSGFLSHPPHDKRIVGNLVVNPEAKLSENEMFLPQVVCFCDIPIEDLPIHIRKYGPFGLSFEKEFIVQHGGAPAFYIPYFARVKSEWGYPPEMMNKASSSDELQELAKGFNKADYFDWMVKFYLEFFDQIEDRICEAKIGSDFPYNIHEVVELQRFINFHILSYTKFFNHDLPDDHNDNYYFEREWRIIGNLNFELDDISRVIIPKSFAKSFKIDQPNYYGQITFSD